MKSKSTILAALLMSAAACGGLPQLANAAATPAHRVARVSLGKTIAPATMPSVFISTNPTHGMQCSGGVCVPIVPYATLNVSDLTAMLATSDVEITTGDPAVDILVNAPFSWTSSYRLTFETLHSLFVNRSISVAGSGGLTITTNVGQSDGRLIFGSQGSVTYLGLTNPLRNPLTVNGQAYVLFDSLPMLIQKVAADSTGRYALSKSYDASVDGTYSHTPIHSFTGSLEGLGNTISNITVNDSTGATVIGGIFGVVSSVDALKLRSLRLTAASTANTYIGGLAGVVTAFSNIAGVSVYGAIVATGGYIGGIAGDSTATIRDSVGGASVRSTGPTPASAGAILGNSEADILDSRGLGKVKVNGNSNAGGLVGHMQYGLILNSDAEGAVTGGVGSNLGGFVGLAAEYHALSLLDGDVAHGAVTGGQHSRVGGFIGSDNTDDSTNAVSVSNSISYGHVSGGTTSGSYTGGFVGFDSTCPNGQYCHMSGDSWDMTTSGITDPSRGAGNVANDPGITGFN